jgi:hypothetical protein
MDGLFTVSFLTSEWGIGMGREVVDDEFGFFVC